MTLLDLGSSIISSVELATKVLSSLSKHYANIQLRNSCYKNQLNEIEICNLGESEAKDVQLLLLDVSDEDCYWNDTQNQLAYTIPFLQAKESKTLKIAYWGFSNTKIQIYVKWKDGRNREQSSEFTLLLKGICDG